MKKIINKIFIFGMVFVSLFWLGEVKAAGISVSASSSSINKGDSVKITATFTSDTKVYFTEGTLVCSGAGVNSKLELGSGEKMNDTATFPYSFSVKATSSGTITCSTSGAKMVEGSSPNEWKSVSGEVSVTVKEPVVIKKPTREYSSNNYLKSLGIEGYDIAPSFDKETKEYSVEVPNGTEKVNIKALKEDSSSSVSGDGEVSVTEGANKIEVKVTAENGNERVYVINVLVKELDPIEVTIDKKKYTIIRKEGVIDPLENYEKDSIKINDNDVLCYRNKVTNVVLVGLKDDSGNAAYYIYDEKKNTYSKYNGIKVGSLYLSILDMPKDKILDGYVKKSFEYEGNRIDGYVFDNSDFYLLYAQNETTGKIGLYMYDRKEGTLQRFNDGTINLYKKKADRYFLYFLISIGVLAISIISFSIVLIKRKDNRYKIKNKNKLK